MQNLKKIFAFVLTLALACCACINAYAKEVADLSKHCSFSVNMTYNGKAVPGGDIVLYKVGRINENDGNYSFTLTKEFKNSKVSLNDVSSPAAAKSLLNYASSNNISGKKVKISSSGKAKIKNLEPGLYLASQSKAADGYKKIAPFLATLPEYENNKYIYNVDASPKLSIYKENTTSPGKSTTSSKKESTTSSGTSAKKKKSTLPYTGQLNWPIPVLAVLGLLLFMAGIVLYSNQKDSET